MLRCDSGKEKIVSVQLFTKTALGGPPDRPVTLTIDGGTPMGANWEFVDKGAYMREDMAVTTLTAAIATAKVDQGPHHDRGRRTDRRDLRRAAVGRAGQGVARGVRLYARHAAGARSIRDKKKK